MGFGPGNTKPSEPGNTVSGQKGLANIFSQLNPATGATVPTIMTLIGLDGNVGAISSDSKSLTVNTTYTGTPSYTVTGAGINGQIKVNDTINIIGQLASQNPNTVTAILIRDTTKNQ